MGNKEKKSPSKHRFQLYEDKDHEGTIEVEEVANRRLVGSSDKKFGSRALNLHRRQENKLKEDNLKGPIKGSLRNHS